jgi:tetraacyldisaccharide 4'-kinase
VEPRVLILTQELIELMKLLLLPITAIYELAVRLRWRCYAAGLFRVARLKKPVISIGNLTMGGTGKTPTTIALARLLQNSGHRVAVLLRGYQGRYRGEPLLVSDGQQVRSNATTAGDEAMVLAENLPRAIIAVAKNRAEAGVWVERHFDVGVHLLDDGFQHLNLHRDLNLLLVDATEPFGGGLPPIGRLREPLEAIGRADAVVFTRTEKSGDCLQLLDTVRKFKPEIPFLVVRQRLDSIRTLGASNSSFESLLHLKALAFAGIANPAQFFKMLQQGGIDLRDSVGFQDHHMYSPADCQRLVRRSLSLGLDTLITTEKDAVKLDAAAFHPLKVLVIKVAFEFDDLEKVRRMVLAAAGNLHR